jgi:hypothetical protein
MKSFAPMSPYSLRLIHLAEVKQAPRRRRTAVTGPAQWLETMVGRVGQVVKQTNIRIFAGDTKSPGKIVSVFEPQTEIIRKGKASKPNEFGKLVKIQDAENQIVPLRGVCRAPCGFDSIAVFHRGTPTEVGTNPTPGGRRCGILLARGREGRTSTGGPVDVGAQQEHYE